MMMTMMLMAVLVQHVEEWTLTALGALGTRPTEGAREKLIAAGAAIWGHGSDPHLDRLYMEEMLERFARAHRLFEQGPGQ